MTLFEMWLGIASVAMLFIFLLEGRALRVAERCAVLMGGLALMLGVWQLAVGPRTEVIGWGFVWVGLAFWMDALKDVRLRSVEPTSRLLKNVLKGMLKGHP